MNILITGICGFAGSVLARTLLQQQAGLRITGIDGAGEKAKWDGETSLMTKAEMNLRARGLAPRVEATEAEPVKAIARKAPSKKAAPKAKPDSTEEA